jgi:hypothetical protein
MASEIAVVKAPSRRCSSIKFDMSKPLLLALDVGAARRRVSGEIRTTAPCTIARSGSASSRAASGHRAVERSPVARRQTASAL